MLEILRYTVGRTEKIDHIILHLLDSTLNTMQTERNEVILNYGRINKFRHIQN